MKKSKPSSPKPRPRASAAPIMLDPPEPTPAPTRSKHAARSPEARARQLAGLRRGSIPRDLTTTEPNLTPTLARHFVALCMAGVPPIDALAFLGPAHYASIHVKARQTWLLTVQTSKLVSDATEAITGGAWTELEPETRLTIALDKHYAELAYFLLTHNFTDADGIVVRKLTEARDALVLKLRAGEGDNGGAFDAFVKLVLGKAATGEVIGAPPVFTPAIPHAQPPTPPLLTSDEDSDTVN